MTWSRRKLVLLLACAVALLGGILFGLLREPPTASSVKEKPPETVGTVDVRTDSPDDRGERSTPVEPVIEPRAEDVMRYARFVVTGKILERPPGAYVALSGDRMRETSRHVVSPDQNFTIVTWDSTLGPPEALVGAPRHLCVFVHDGDPRWNSGEFDVVLEPSITIDLLLAT